VIELLEKKIRFLSFLTLSDSTDYLILLHKRDQIRLALVYCTILRKVVLCFLARSTKVLLDPSTSTFWIHPQHR